MKRLFLEELEDVRGGHHREGHDRPPRTPPGQCPDITTLACGEEGGCSGC